MCDVPYSMDWCIPPHKAHCFRNTSRRWLLDCHQGKSLSASLTPSRQWRTSSLVESATHLERQLLSVAPRKLSLPPTSTVLVIPGLVQIAAPLWKMTPQMVTTLSSKIYRFKIMLHCTHWPSWLFKTIFSCLYFLCVLIIVNLPIIYVYCYNLYASIKAYKCCGCLITYVCTWLWLHVEYSWGMHGSCMHMHTDQAAPTLLCN